MALAGLQHPHLPLTLRECVQACVFVSSASCHTPDHDFHKFHNHNCIVTLLSLHHPQPCSQPQGPLICLLVVLTFSWFISEVGLNRFLKWWAAGSPFFFYLACCTISAFLFLWLCSIPLYVFKKQVISKNESETRMQVQWKNCQRHATVCADRVGKFQGRGCYPCQVTGANSHSRCGRHCCSSGHQGGHLCASPSALSCGPWRPARLQHTLP